MITANVEPVSTPLVAPTPATSSTNMALTRCCEAYKSAYMAAKAQQKGKVFAELDAESAFRRAMPSLTGQENIRDFIACTAHGILISAIKSSDGARLIYAAQVAFGALRSVPTS